MGVLERIAEIEAEVKKCFYYLLQAVWNSRHNNLILLVLCVLILLWSNLAIIP